MSGAICSGPDDPPRRRKGGREQTGRRRPPRPLPVILTRGAYTVGVAIYDQRIRRCLDLKPAATFTVEGPSMASREVSGHVVYPHSWEIDSADGTSEGK